MRRIGNLLRAALQAFGGNQPRLAWRRILLATCGTSLAVLLLGLVGGTFDLQLVFLGFAPTCLLVFVLPEAPVSQPLAVIGGHGVSAAIGITFTALLPHSTWGAALVAGGSVLAMSALRVLHPPAITNAVIPFITGANWWYLVSPILVACVLIVLAALIWHRCTRVTYPVRQFVR